MRVTQTWADCGCARSEGLSMEEGRDDVYGEYSDESTSQVLVEDVVKTPVSASSSMNTAQEAVPGAVTPGPVRADNAAILRQSLNVDEVTSLNASNKNPLQLVCPFSVSRLHALTALVRLTARNSS